MALEIFVQIATLIESLVSVYGLPGIFIAAIIANASIFLPLPMDVIVFGLAGFSENILFALLLGLVAGVGAGIGEMSAYLLGRLGISTVERITNKKITHIEEYQYKLRRKGMVFIFLASVTPFPFDLIGIIAGLIRYDWRKFFIAGVLGKIVRYEIFVIAGFYGIQAVRTYFFF
jgi:membrane protein YqaA with SNARE-associated domain